MRRSKCQRRLKCSSAPPEAVNEGQSSLIIKVPPPPFTTLMSAFTNYDSNGDGRIEINSLKAAFPSPEAYSPAPNGVVIVFVDPRLLSDDPTNAVSRTEMLLWLGIYSSDS
jgi:hypothetical protein